MHFGSSSEQCPKPSDSSDSDIVGGGGIGCPGGGLVVRLINFIRKDPALPLLPLGCLSVTISKY